MSSAGLGWALGRGLASADINHVVVCPGSRSTAAAVAIARFAEAGLLCLHTRTDERAAGFLALGLAKADGAAAIVVTSGTAVGNLMPAVMEARAAGVPLVVVTADRPATLIGTGANQTTHQAGIFGRQVVDELGMASTDDAPKAWGAQLARVLASAWGTRTRRPGPVHINAAFTEPFTDPGEAAEASFRFKLMSLDESRPQIPTPFPAGLRTVILAGDAPAGVGRRAREVAESSRTPLFAEPSSNARAGDCAIAGYRLLLDSPLGERIQRVFVFGHPTLSRPVSRLLARDDIELTVVSDQAGWPDPGWSVSRVCDDVQLAAGDPGWLDEWRQADRHLGAHSAASDSTGTISSKPSACPPAAEEQPAAVLPGDRAVDRIGPGTTPAPGLPAAPLTGQAVADAVVASRPRNLVFGASNLIRNADLSPIADLRPAGGMSPASPQTICWANRGLAGIDGTISTAIGIALGTERPATVLLGDLSFLHDIGSLHLPAGQPVPDLRIVVGDDNGGSIFSTLEVADSPCYEQLFAMPHGRDLAAIAEGFGWPTHRIADREQLVGHLVRPVRGIEILIAVLGA